jgi:hypothetical protein
MSPTEVGSRGGISLGRLAAALSRWSARLIGVFLIGLVVLFTFGEGPPPLMRMPPHIVCMFLAQLVSLAGFIVLWRWPVCGGVSSIMGITAFYLINHSVSGRFPGGWVFPLFFVPGILILLSWAIDRVCPAQCPARP